MIDGGELHKIQTESTSMLDSVPHLDSIITQLLSII